MRVHFEWKHRTCLIISLISCIWAISIFNDNFSKLIWLELANNCLFCNKYDLESAQLNTMLWLLDECSRSTIQFRFSSNWADIQWPAGVHSNEPHNDSMLGNVKTNFIQMFLAKLKCLRPYLVSQYRQTKTKNRMKVCLYAVILSITSNLWSSAEG